MIHDRARISLSLSLLFSIYLPLFYVSAIVIKSVRRTGRGLLQLPPPRIVPPSVSLTLSSALAVRRPRLPVPLSQQRYAPLYHPYALPSLPPPVPVSPAIVRMS